MKQPTPEMLLAAYSQGLFPMAVEELDWAVRWFAPERRTTIPVGGVHISKTLAKTIRRELFEIRIDTAFTRVIQACAVPRLERDGVWLSEPLRNSYIELHQLGFAHSVEAWQDGELVGGLYGVTLRGLFAGESMFHHVTDASKVCMAYLDAHLVERGFVLHDCQFMTEHLRSMGAIERPREEYDAHLMEAMSVDAHF